MSGFGDGSDDQARRHCGNHPGVTNRAGSIHDYPSAVKNSVGLVIGMRSEKKDQSA